MKRFESFADPRPFFAAALTVIILLVSSNVPARNALSAGRVATWDQQNFLASERDDHGRLISTAFALDAVESNQPKLVFIGGSTLREGLVPDPVATDRLDQLAPSLGASVHTLYSFDQSLAETYRIASNIPLAPGDTVVISVNPRRLSFERSALSDEANRSRISLLDGASVMALDRQLDGRDRWPSQVLAPWENLSAFEHRLFLRNWISGRLQNATTDAWTDLVELRLGAVDWGRLVDFKTRDVRNPVRYAYPPTPLSDFDKGEIAEATASIRVGEYFDNAEHGTQILRSTIELIEQTGASVAILELPRDERSTQAFGPVWQDYESKLAQIAADFPRLARLDLRSIDYGTDAFYDLEHLLASYRRDLTDQVLREILNAW